MARNDIRFATDMILKSSVQPSVASGTTSSIKKGEPTKWATGTGVSAMVDGDGTTSQRFTGIAKEDSTETTSVAGICDVWLPYPGHVYAAKAKSAAAADTYAEIQALFNKRVVFDLTSTIWTIDTAAADAATNAVNIVGGEYQTSTIFFTVINNGTLMF